MNDKAYYYLIDEDGNLISTPPLSTLNKAQDQAKKYVQEAVMESGPTSNKTISILLEIERIQFVAIKAKDVPTESIKLETMD